ncbi:NAD-dependent epimerase/dehydratase family protein [Vibrio splendidus]|uniref:NAD-dependent epimerase/dehydratase family protein n=1 Tax=Vibrio splendidus TaxID=29497 RepID=UPI0009C0702B|nr:NAD-dependent epimerase/dehydratase family protein [Vibrio splendidus]CAH6817187.1 UDP-glucose 4-epimerase [Vibrio chagasii]
MSCMVLTGKGGFIGRNMPANFKKIDLRKPKHEWDLKGCDVVVHLAGLAHHSYSEAEYLATNTEMTIKLASYAASLGISRFVFLSSMNISWEQDKSIPSNPAIYSKYMAEKQLFELSNSTGIEVVIVRSPLVYGQCAPGNFGALTRIIDKFPILPFGLVKNKRDFISVQNLVDLLVICASHPAAAGHTFLASDGETVSTKEFTNAIAKGLGKKIYQLPIPVSLMRFAGKLLGKSAMVEQLVGNLQVDSSDLKKVLGWTPPYTMEESMTFLKKTK